MYFHKKTTPQVLGHIGLQNMKVGEKTNLGRLATIFQICSMDVDILEVSPPTKRKQCFKMLRHFLEARYPLPKMNKMAAQNNENKNGNQKKSYPKFFFIAHLV